MIYLSIGLLTTCLRPSLSWPLVYFCTCLPVQVYLSPCLHFTYIHVNLSICLSSYLSSCLLVYLLIYQTTKCLFFTFLPKTPKSLDLPLQKANKYYIFTKQVKYSLYHSNWTLVSHKNCELLHFLLS